MSDLARPLAASAERMFADQCVPEVVNAAQRGEWPAALWRTIEELDLANVLVAEKYGGAGGDWTDACALLQCVGAASVPVPIAETLYVRWLLDAAGVCAPDGPLTFAFLSDPRGLKRAGKVWQVNARLRKVPWARACAAIILIAPIAKGARVLCVPKESTTIVSGSALSGEPRDDVKVNKARIPIAAGADVTTAYADAYAHAALMRAALIGGALKHVLALSIAYARERTQFGKPLAAFQAIQQNLAVLAEEVAATHVAVAAAARACGTEWAAANIAAAKIQAGTAAGVAARIAHQIHGAMGATFEHSLHQSTRRLWTWRDEYGAEDFWARRLAEFYRERGDTSVWATLTVATSG